MRLSVEHTETFTYETPSMGTIQVLRLTPRDHTGHYICDWTVDVDEDCKIETSTDAFGNILTSFSLPGPLEKLTITAGGEVETEETHGIIRGSAEKVPDGVFLRPSLAESEAPVVRSILHAVDDGEGSALSRMHHLMNVIHAALPDAGEQEDSTPDQAQMQAQAAGLQKQRQQAAAATSQNIDELAAKRLGAIFKERKITDAIKIAPLFCEAARKLGLPARLVAGYRLLDDNAQTKDERDVWAEVLVDELGWVGFDPLHNACPSAETVRVAVGLDLAGIAATRIGHYGSVGPFEQKTSIAVSRIGG
jgi:transglutaminase-like putative cysteine protease